MKTTPNLRKLYIQSKLFQKANKYKYLWTKNGRIFLRKGDDTKVIRVFPNIDFTKIEESGSDDGQRNNDSGERREN